MKLSNTIRIKNERDKLLIELVSLKINISNVKIDVELSMLYLISQKKLVLRDEFFRRCRNLGRQNFKAEENLGRPKLRAIRKIYLKGK